jgi:radical SAM protein with 4Fe4S-binding SPASM domain
LAFPALAEYLVPKLSGVAIEPTNVCNLRCVTCYKYKTRTEGLMDFKLFKKIVDELERIAPQNVGLSYGGESLLHPQIEQMIAYAVGKFSEVGIFTNGMLMSGHISSLLNLDAVTVSMDGVGQVNDDLRCGASYQTLKRNILKLLMARGNGSRPRVTINVTQSSQTERQIRKIVTCWIGLVDQVNVNPALTIDQLKMMNNDFYDEETKAGHYCDQPFTYMGIFWNGDVVPCCHDINGLNKIGNIRHDTITRVWKSKAFRTLRHACANGSFLSFPLCCSCEVWKRRFKLKNVTLGSARLTFVNHRKEYRPELF